MRGEGRLRGAWASMRVQAALAPVQPIPSHMQMHACLPSLPRARCLCKLLDGIQDHYTYAQPGIQRTLFHVRELVR